MRTDMNPESRHYLAAVERAASELPAERRHELIADLSEHIQVALAERPGAITEILAELGDPRTIAATALHEDDTALHVRHRRGNPMIPVLQLTLAALWALVVGYSSAPDALLPPAFFLLGAGLVALWRSPWWTRRQKWAATVATVFLPAIMNVLWDGYGKGHGFTTMRVLLDITQAGLRLGGPAWLWRHRNAPAQPDAAPHPRNTWLRPLLLGLLTLAVLTVAGLALGALWVFHGLSSNTISTGL